MTFQEFIEVYNGRYIDFDGYYGPQCMDLLHTYCVDVLGISDGRVLAANSAKEIYENFDTVYGHEQFEKIANTPEGIPQEGDIVFWGIGTYGHVAVFVEGNVSAFRSFDQNFPVGSPCHIQNHTSYSGVLGWLRCKPTAHFVHVEAPTFENFVRKSTIYDAIVSKLNVADSQTIVLAEVDKFIDYEDAVAQKDKQLQEARDQIAQLQKEAQVKENELKTLQEDVAKLTERVDTAVSENKSLQIALQEAQQASQQPIFTGWKAIIYKWLVRR